MERFRENQTRSSGSEVIDGLKLLVPIMNISGLRPRLSFGAAWNSSPDSYRIYIQACAWPLFWQVAYAQIIRDLKHERSNLLK